MGPPCVAGRGPPCRGPSHQEESFVRRTSASEAAALVTAPRLRFFSAQEPYGVGLPLGVSPARGSLQPHQQLLQAKCCFDITLPEDTKGSHRRKGASRNPLKRLLKIPRGGWRRITPSVNKNTSKPNDRSSTALKATFSHTPSGGGCEELLLPPAGAAAPRASIMASRFVDIGANLCDPMYEGKYHDKQKHPPDIHLVLRRAEAAGVDKIILTSGAFEDLRTNLKIAELYDPECERLFMTAGIHPTRCTEFAAPSSTTSGIESEFFDSFAAKVEEAGLRLSEYPEVYVQRLFEVHQELQRDQQRQRKRRIVAVGEIGLDYDRLHFCDAPTQKQCFELQLALCHTSRLPLFLHMRNAASDFIDILQRRENLWRPRGGVAHSFTGTAEEAKQLLDAGLYIGLNGCSLKTQENLAVVQQLPLSRILLETGKSQLASLSLQRTATARRAVALLHEGFAESLSKKALCGWFVRKNRCSLRSLLNGVKPEKWEAESQVKGRNEPCNIRAVAAIVRQLVAPELSEEDFCSRFLGVLVLPLVPYQAFRATPLRVSALSLRALLDSPSRSHISGKAFPPRAVTTHAEEAWAASSSASQAHEIYRGGRQGAIAHAVAEPASGVPCVVDRPQSKRHLLKRPKLSVERANSRGPLVFYRAT
ncbi:family domain-containing protein [Cyclospora cayetanensis]|uniref:Family domain-containing protein n=1 Tax=Cyclospora cayetanensis TaxID=88456 RepID=A0A1D3D3M9_9EIME|nr:family domain-containing protein [Cyclospora cayetanensis]